MNLLLWTWLLFAPERPALQVDPEGWWTVPIPLELLEDASLEKKLYSGLTTTFELRATFEPRRDDDFFAMLQVRYEIWEEVFIITRLEADGRLGRRQFATLEETAAWLRREPLRIARVGGGKNLIVRVRLIPFSRGDELIAEDWFARVLRVPDAVTTGQVDRNRDRSLDDSGDGSGIFEVLMTKSIRRRSIRTVKWAWRLEGGG